MRAIRGCENPSAVCARARSSQDMLTYLTTLCVNLYLNKTEKIEKGLDQGRNKSRFWVELLIIL